MEFQLFKMCLVQLIIIEVYEAWMANVNYMLMFKVQCYKKKTRTYKKERSHEKKIHNYK